MPDATPRIIGLAAEQLRKFFDPNQAAPPLGGGTTKIHIVAGDTVPPPPWMSDQDTDCGDCCSVFVWVRLVRRYRAVAFPSEVVSTDCRAQKVIEIEAGVSRCAPLELSEEQAEHQAAVQWDDGNRVDLALCAAMLLAEQSQAAMKTALMAGEPWGPEGLVIAWFQNAAAQLP